MTPVPPVPPVNLVVAIPLPDGRWIAMPAADFAAALARGSAYGPNAAPAQAPMAAQHLVDSKEMAARLGVPDTWVEAAAKTGDIPSVRVGRYLRFSPTEVLSAIKTRHADSRTATHA